MAIGIRKKIGISFFIFMLVSTLIWFANYYKHELIYEKLQIIEKKDYLFNKILEARRYEKNYFLFENPDDLRESINYVIQAQDSLRTIIQAYSEYTLERDLESRYRDLEDYLQALQSELGENLPGGTVKAAGEAALDVEVQQETIRNLGRKITDDFEAIIGNERRQVYGLFQESTYYLYFALAAIFILTALTALFIFFNINRPLKSIENAIHKIAIGDYKDIPQVATGDVFGPLVTSLNDMIRKLNQRNRQIVQTEKLASLGTLTSGVAHELNNPLNNISTSVQILMEELEDDDLAYKRELLTETEAQIDRARDIVRALLEFSRKGDFKPMPVAFHDLVRKTLTLLKGDLPANITLQVDVPKEIRANLDAQRIQQVLINLIQNAIQSMPAGGIVRIAADQPEGDQSFRLRVADSGKGIAKSDLKKIFDPFFTTKDVSSGSGLGLSISHGIIEQHNGRINVASQPGEGTTFSIYLPTGLELEASDA